MNEMEKILSGQPFTRVHKSYIVGNNAIRSIEPNAIIIDKYTIPVGSTYKEKLMSLVAGKS